MSRGRQSAKGQPGRLVGQVSGAAQREALEIEAAQPYVQRLLADAAASPAALRIAVAQRQRDLRARHQHLDRRLPGVARALELAARHRGDVRRATR